MPEFRIVVLFALFQCHISLALAIILILSPETDNVTDGSTPLMRRNLNKMLRFDGVGVHNSINLIHPFILIAQVSGM
jgi:hypothetical protein